MKEFFDKMDIYFEKDWLFFGIVIVVLLILKIVEARRYKEKIPAAITGQITILICIWLLIIIFGMSNVAAGIVIFLFLIIAFMERLKREADKFYKKEKEFLNSYNKGRPH